MRLMRPWETGSELQEWTKSGDQHALMTTEVKLLMRACRNQRSDEKLHNAAFLHS